MPSLSARGGSGAAGGGSRRRVRPWREASGRGLAMGHGARGMHLDAASSSSRLAARPKSQPDGADGRGSGPRRYVIAALGAMRRHDTSAPPPGPESREGGRPRHGPSARRRRRRGGVDARGIDRRTATVGREQQKAGRRGRLGQKRMRGGTCRGRTCTLRGGSAVPVCNLSQHTPCQPRRRN